MIRIAICDDEPEDILYLVKLIEKYFLNKSYTYQLEHFADGKFLMDEIQDQQKYNVIFMDIFMAHSHGLETAWKIKSVDPNTEILFTTVSSEFAIASYDVQASGYLVKPIAYDKLASALDRIIKKYNQSVFIAQNGACCEQFTYNQIVYIESNNTRCMIHSDDGRETIVYKKLSEIESQLCDQRFLRCHQSYLVNMDYIHRADKQFYLTTGETVLIRQKQLKAIRDKFYQYLILKES